MCVSGNSGVCRDIFGERTSEEGELQEIERGLQAFSLPVRTEGLEAGKIVEVTRSDKKMEAGSIKFVLLRGIGEAFVDKTVTEKELLSASAWILGDSNDETCAI